MESQLSRHIKTVYEQTKKRRPFHRFHTLRMEKLLRFYTNNQFVDQRDIELHLRLIHRVRRTQRLGTNQFLNLLYCYSCRMIREFKNKDIRTPQPVNIKSLARKVRTG